MRDLEACLLNVAGGFGQSSTPCFSHQPPVTEAFWPEIPCDDLTLTEIFPLTKGGPGEQSFSVGSPGTTSFPFLDSQTFHSRLGASVSGSQCWQWPLIFVVRSVYSFGRSRLARLWWWSELYRPEVCTMPLSFVKISWKEKWLTGVWQIQSALNWLVTQSRWTPALLCYHKIYFWFRFCLLFVSAHDFFFFSQPYWGMISMQWNSPLSVHSWMAFGNCMQFCVHHYTQATEHYSFLVWRLVDIWIVSILDCYESDDDFWHVFVYSYTSLGNFSGEQRSWGPVGLLWS